MPEQMQALRKTKMGKGLELTEIPIPKIKGSEVLVRVKASSMCGTDIHIYNWDPPWSNGRFSPPKTLGHELAGEVVEVGKDVKSVKAGDFVSAESHIPCYACFQCRTGDLHVCQNLKFLSVDMDGGFAEYAAIPESIVWKNPKGMKPEVASLQESLGNSVYSVQKAEVFGKTVAIFGLGPTGLFATGLARAAGAAKIMVVGGTETHLRIARQMGADVLINRHEMNTAKEIRELTEGVGADVFMEMSGSAAALEQGLEALRLGGRAVLLGLPTGPVSLDISRHIVLNLTDLHGIYGRRLFETWYTTSRLLSSGRLDITPIITHRLSLGEYEKAIQAMESGSCGKVVFRT